MKSLIFITLSCLCFIQSFSQNTTVLYSEDFEDPSQNYKVTNGITTTAGQTAATISFKDTSIYQTNGNNSYHVQGSSTFNDVWFETDDFSTIGYPYPSLSFDHICKLFLSNTAIIEISTDMGNSWRNLNDTSYQGNSPLYDANEYFNEGAYVSNNNLWSSGQNISPTNSWWVTENFDLRGYAYDTISNSGYPNIRLRFKATFIFDFPVGSGTFFDGWFLDQIEVKGSTCETYPPIIHGFLNDPVTGCENKPEGKVVADNFNLFKVTAKITDKGSGLDKAKLIWENNNVHDTVIMILNGSTFDEYNGLISNATIGDSIFWHIEAFDSDCPNVTYSPDTSIGNYLFYVTDDVPLKCGSPECISHPSTIDTFPWLEDFEGSEWTPGNGNGNGFVNTHRGDFPTYPNGQWTIAPNTLPINQNSYAWCVANGPTGTFNTGPSQNHTLNGSKYLYTEGSLSTTATPTTISSTKITTPCINLTQQTNPLAFEFYYHFFGEDIGNLRIDIDTGTTNEAWLIGHYIIRKEQQDSSNSAWKKASFPLNPFFGKFIKIRLLSVKSGNGSKADMAIDDLAITFPDSLNVSVLNINTPIINNCSYSNSETINITVQNDGFTSISQIPIAYEVNSGIIVRDTVLGNSNFGDTINYDFTQKVDFSAIGKYTLKVWTELPFDSNRDNDTISNIFETLFVLDTFPFKESFKNSISASNLNSNGSLNSNFFEIQKSDSNSNAANWIVFRDKVRSLNSGPKRGADDQDNYLLFLDPNGVQIDDEAELLSSCINFQGLTAPQLSFKYHNLSDSIALMIRIREFGTREWLKLDSLNTIAKNKGDQYIQKQYDLSSYSDKTVEISFLAKNGQPHNDQYIAIDDITLFDQAPIDNGLSSLNSPYIINESSQTTFSTDFVLFNAGASLQLNQLQLKIELEEKCNQNPQLITGQTIISNKILPSLRSSFLTNDMVTYSSPIPAGNYRVKAWIETLNDTNYFNDTIYRELLVVPKKTIPYFNDFENCTNEFYSAGRLSDWDKTIPNKGIGWNSSKSGQNSWVTHDSANTITGSTEYLISPSFNGFDSIYDAEIKFWHQYDFGQNGHGIVQYYIQGVWKDLYQSVTPGINWMSPKLTNFGSYAFEGNSGGWISSIYPLSIFNKSPFTTQFRFILEGDSIGKGWIIDDFEVTIPTQNSASPSNISFGNQLPQIGSNSISIEIINTGAAPLSELNLSILNNNSLIYSGHITLTNSILKGKTALINIPVSLGLTAGNNLLQINTSLPNNKVDGRTIDDTLFVSIPILNPINNYPYCTDFESERSFLNYNTLKSKIDTNWIYGNPNKSILSSSFSGSYSWYVSSGLYGPLNDQYLFTPTFDIVSGQCYLFSFQHQFETEFNFDGGMIQYTSDNGNTWETFGNYQDSTWYNTPHIQSLDAINPGWSGSSSGWMHSEKVIQFNDPGEVQFRFRFGSNTTVFNEGWVIDDFCFEPISGLCDYIGIEEFNLSNSLLELYPNPSNEKIKFIYSGIQNENASVLILNSIGATVRDNSEFIQSGIENELNISDLPKGTYMLRIVFSNQNSAVKWFQKN